MPTPTRSWRQSTGRMSALAAASISDVVGYALRNSAPSILRMRAMASTTLTLGAPLASRLREEDRDPSCGLRLVFLVGRRRGHGELPQSRPLGLVGDLAERGALLPTAPLVEVDLIAHPLPGAGDVVGHGDSSHEFVT